METRTREAIARGTQCVVTSSWLLLLASGLLPVGHTLVATALCLVTISAALGTWVRVVLRPGGALPWALLAVGWSAYAAGFVIVLALPGVQHYGPGALNLSDTISLALYPSATVGLLLLSGARGRRRGRAQLLDAGILGLSFAALATTWAAMAYPSLLQGDAAHVVYALAYPVGGATLLIAALTSLASVHWQADRYWLLILSGFGAMTVGDAVYGAQSAAGTFRFGTPLDAAYTAGPLLVCLAAWRRPSVVAPRPADARFGLAAPALATGTTLTLLILAHMMPLPLLMVVLASLAGVCGLLRTALFVQQEIVTAQSLRDASTDDMTGLWNRRALLKELADRAAERRATTLVLVDLLGVARINDALGHTAGDRVLCEMAARTRVVPGVRMAARLVGDEFAVVSDDVEDGGRALALLLRAAVQQPYVLDDLVLSVDATCGSAELLVADAPSPGELLRRGRVALDRARRRGSSVEAYEPELDRGARERLALVADLRAALAHDELVVHFQPKPDPRTRIVHGLEALVRWQHPQRGLLGPADFLDGAEAAGLLPALTTKVLDLSLRGVAALRREGMGGPYADLQVAVNVGAPDLLDPGLLDQLRDRLLAHQLPPAALRLEVTETVVMSDPAKVLTTLAGVRALGIGVSLDDFGTGLSSLSYLRDLPVDELKIDRSFVSNMAVDPASALIVSSTVDLAHGLGLSVVAEGVEDEATLAALIATGCDLVQGYLLGRPLSLDALRAALFTPAPVPGPRLAAAAHAG